MNYSNPIKEAKQKLDSVNEFINLIEKNSETFKEIGISISFKNKTVI